MQSGKLKLYFVRKLGSMYRDLVLHNISVLLQYKSYNVATIMYRLSKDIKSMGFKD